MDGEEFLGYLVEVELNSGGGRGGGCYRQSICTAVVVTVSGKQAVSAMPSWVAHSSD